MFRAGGDLEAAPGPGEKDPPRRPRLLFRAGGGDLEPAPGEKEPCRPSLLLRLFLAGGDLIQMLKIKSFKINNLISFHVSTYEQYQWKKLRVLNKTLVKIHIF